MPKTKFDLTTGILFSLKTLHPFGAVRAFRFILFSISESLSLSLSLLSFSTSLLSLFSAPSLLSFSLLLQGYGQS